MVIFLFSSVRYVTFISYMTVSTELHGSLVCVGLNVNKRYPEESPLRDRN